MYNLDTFGTRSAQMTLRTEIADSDIELDLQSIEAVDLDEGQCSVIKAGC
jgi:hypothetical protein